MRATTGCVKNFATLITKLAQDPRRAQNLLRILGVCLPYTCLCLN